MFLQIAGEHKKEYLKSLFSGIGAIVCAGAIYVSFYSLFMNLSEGNSRGTHGAIMTMGIFFVLFLVLKFKSSAYDHGSNHGNFVDVGHDLREKLGRKLVSVPLSSVARYKTGDLNAILSSNVGEAVMFMNMVPLMALELVITGAIIVLATFFVSVKLAVLMLLMLPVAVPLYRLRRRLAIEEKSEFIAANANLESQIIEYIQGIGVLRSIDKTGENAANLRESIAAVRQIQLRAMRLAGAPTLAMGSIAVILMN